MVIYFIISFFGIFDIEGMVIIFGNWVVEWFYIGLGEEIF